MMPSSWLWATTLPVMVLLGAMFCAMPTRFCTTCHSRQNFACCIPLLVMRLQQAMEMSWQLTLFWTEQPVITLSLHCWVLPSKQMPWPPQPAILSESNLCLVPMIKKPVQQNMKHCIGGNFGCAENVKPQIATAHLRPLPCGCLGTQGNSQRVQCLQ